ncbi:MAG: bifunctional diaminohydroxyphosphoribosylaminopyrimidine deaminase/5-amino-6-(5-phosphoribosylamino)uracil reductase RibD, partial [Fervidobacterium sp.]
MIESGEKKIHERYMKMAIKLAKKGIGLVNPNPPVGAVIVKEGKVISAGYHKKYGGYHAERNAILSA